MRLGLADTAAITEAPAGDPVWKLEAALYCEPCSEGRHFSRRQRAHILGLDLCSARSGAAEDARPQGELEAMTKLMPDRARSAQKSCRHHLRPFVV